MDDDGLRRVAEHVQRDALRGRVPRHVIDVELGPDTVDPRYEDACRQLLDEARSAAGEICGTLEQQIHELSALEEAGVSDRIRYLTAVASVASGVDLRLRTDGDLDRLSYLRTVHRVVDRWREGATHDLSNVLGPLEFLPTVGRSREEILAHWIWLNLGDGNEHRHLTWVKSTMRFARAYGEEVLRRFGPESGEEEPASQEQRGDEVPGVSRARARRIAESYLEENPVPGATGKIRKVLTWDEIDARRPNVYGFGEPYWRSHWVVYLEREAHGLYESLIMAVHRDSGDVGYVGGASDEG